MQYQDIIDMALKYADRFHDNEISDMMDSFLYMVESRVNKNLKVQKMTCRAQIITQPDQEYYGLPADFSGLRDIEIRNEDASRTRYTLDYMSPEQMNTYSGQSDNRIFYNIIANQLQIMPPADNLVLEIVYYRKVPHLSDTKLDNWLSIDFPDVYVFGLMVEINSYVKDAQSTELWDIRFRSAMDELENYDQLTRWSGTALTMRTG